MTVTVTVQPREQEAGALRGGAEKRCAEATGRLSRQPASQAQAYEAEEEGKAKTTNIVWCKKSARWRDLTTGRYCKNPSMTM